VAGDYLRAYNNCTESEQLALPESNVSTKRIVDVLIFWFSRKGYIALHRTGIHHNNTLLATSRSQYASSCHPFASSSLGAGGTPVVGRAAMLSKLR
jgi:hypothetical protein